MSLSIQNHAQEAIAEALKGNFQNAIELNRQILEKNPSDIDALNRLAYAMASTGNFKQAKFLYRQVLSFDRFNLIASKNIAKLKEAGTGKTKTQKTFSPRLSVFLEEPGKTKIVSLVNVASPSVLSGLVSGQKVKLIYKRRSLIVTDENKTYLGALPDDLTRRLIFFLKGGNLYEVFVKSVSKNSLSVFIREIKRVKRFEDKSSFGGSFSSYNASLPSGFLLEEEEKTEVESEEKEEGEE